MELLSKHRLLKLKKKNKGNSRLIKEIDKFISDIECNSIRNRTDLKKLRPDADCAHSDGFYFFDLYAHRTMILVVFEDNEATVVWTSTNSEYDKTFKANKDTIEKWLRNQHLI